MPTRWAQGVPITEAPQILSHAHHVFLLTETATMKPVYLESLIPEDLTDPEAPQSLTIDAFPSLVGRSPECDHQISNVLVSRRHCLLFDHEGELYVRDLGSRNGTYLNGLLKQNETVLHDDDRLDIGYLPYRVCLTKQSAMSKALERARAWY